MVARSDALSPIIGKGNRTREARKRRLVSPRPRRSAPLHNVSEADIRRIALAAVLSAFRSVWFRQANSKADVGRWCGRQLMVEVLILETSLPDRLGAFHSACRCRSGGVGKAGVIQPAPQLYGADAGAVRMGRVEQHATLFRYDDRGDNQNRRTPTTQPCRAKVDANAACRLGIPADGQARRGLPQRGGPDRIGDRDLHQIPVERKAPAARCTSVSRQASERFSAA